MPALMLVMPVRDEQDSVSRVALEWFRAVGNCTEDFVFVAIDDGSTDGTPAILQRLRETLGPRFEIVGRANAGHGQTCLEGYRLAVERRIPYVFQLDSDGQCSPRYFIELWRDREKYDVIYGRRVDRRDGWRRMLATKALRACLFVWSGVDCVDANVPYRLMRTEVLAEVLPGIPPTFFLANVALAVLLRRRPGTRHGAVPICFDERCGGEPAIKLSSFWKRALELRRELKELRGS